MKILLFILSLSTIYTQEMYNASEFIERLRKETPANETILKESIESTQEFLKHYIYYTISSDPPQPNFNNSYFPKIDIQNLFKDITTKNTNYFDFKNEFYSAVEQLNDFHIQPYILGQNFENYIYICPLTLKSKYDNITKIAKMYGDFSLEPDYYFFFKNYEQVVKVIKDNLNIPIKTINGKNPFNFIQEFAGINLRNKHSTYVYKQQVYTKNSFHIPATLKDLTNFKVIYENDQSFETEYIIQIINNNQQNSYINFYENHEDNEKFRSFLSNENNKLNNIFSKNNHGSEFFSLSIKNLDNIILEFEKKNNVQSNNIFLTPNKIKKKWKRF